MGAEARRESGTRDEICQSVVWREHERRCELWMIDGNSCLRLYEGERLLMEEPVLHGALRAQAIALRTWTPSRQRRRQFGARD